MYRVLTWRCPVSMLIDFVESSARQSLLHACNCSVYSCRTVKKSNKTIILPDSGVGCHLSTLSTTSRLQSTVDIIDAADCIPTVCVSVLHIEHL